jgi:hypothetical protein
VLRTATSLRGDQVITQGRDLSDLKAARALLANLKNQ